MDSPLLELKIVSANDLKKPSPFSSALQPYVVVSLSGAGVACPAQKTPADSAGGRNPVWNYPLTISLPGGVATTTAANLRFQILSRRALAADKHIGEVCVPLYDLFSSPATDPQAPPKFVTYQVKKPSGRPKGALTFSYKLAGKFPGAAAAAAAEEPVMAYPAAPKPNFYPPPPSAPPANVGYPAVDAYNYKQDVYPPPPVAPATSYGYPAQAGYGYGYGSCGYGYPNQTGYGYGSGYGYGYGGPVVQRNRKRGNGLGLGAGLLGGALAGLVVGDLVSDAAFDFGGGDGFF